MRIWIEEVFRRERVVWLCSIMKFIVFVFFRWGVNVARIEFPDSHPDHQIHQYHTRTMSSVAADVALQAFFISTYFRMIILS